MKTLHRIYSWLLFPVIATLFVLFQIVFLLFSLLNNFHFGNFYTIEVPDEFPFDSPRRKYFGRFIMAILIPFGVFWDGLKSLNEYKF